MDKSKPKLESAPFIVSKRQMALDMEMIPFDIWGTKVHILMLYSQGIIDKLTAKRCLKALLDTEKDLGSGKFTIDSEKGAQLTLEAGILAKAWEAGYSGHTGRSRKDSVIT